MGIESESDGKFVLPGYGKTFPAGQELAESAYNASLDSQKIFVPQPSAPRILRVADEYSIEPCSQTRVCRKGLKAFARSR